MKALHEPPDELVLLHDHSDQFSVQCNDQCLMRELNRTAAAFLRAETRGMSEADLERHRPFPSPLAYNTRVKEQKGGCHCQRTFTGPLEASYTTLWREQRFYRGLFPRPCAVLLKIPFIFVVCGLRN